MADHAFPELHSSRSTKKGIKKGKLKRKFRDYIIHTSIYSKWDKNPTTFIKYFFRTRESPHTDQDQNGPAWKEA